MLYKTLLKLKEKNRLTDDLKNKIDVFFAVGRITEDPSESGRSYFLSLIPYNLLPVFHLRHY